MVCLFYLSSQRTIFYLCWFLLWSPLFLFFKFKFIYFNLRLITLQYCIGFANMNLPQVYKCCPSWTPLPPPSLYHLSGYPRAPAPSILYPALNLDWWFISYMILYMFQCHSPKSFYPLPRSPKDCSIHLCLSFCLAYRVIILIFLNSIYMC